MADLLFSVTREDCEWSYTRGRGAGGQKKNKTSSAVHCKHPPSGAHGYAEDSRSQHDNKRTAFVRMTESPEFRRWHRMEIMRRSGEAAALQRAIEDAMRQVKVEIRVDGKWTPVDKDAPLSTEET